MAGFRDELKKALLPFVPPPLQRLRWSSLGILGVALRDLGSNVARLARDHVTHKHVAVVAVWLSCAFVARQLEFGAVFVLLSAFVLMFTAGLGNKEAAGGPFRSAYSVFNVGQRSMLGSLNAEQFESELRHTAVDRDSKDGDTEDAKRDDDDDDWVELEERDLREALTRSLQEESALKTSSKTGTAGTGSSKKKAKQRRRQAAAAGDKQSI